MSARGRVFIVDDDAAVRDSLTMLLETAGLSVATFSCAEDFLKVCTSSGAVCPVTEGSEGVIDGPTNQCAECIIIDVNMPGMNGPALQHELNQRGIQLPMIFLSGHGTIPTTVNTIKAGALDFLTKPVKGAVLLKSVNEALAQSLRIKRQFEEYQAVASRLRSLTEREREVMVLAIAGHTSKEIAQNLSISFRTVEIHRSHVMHKTGAANLLELARIASIAGPHRD